MADQSIDLLAILGKNLNRTMLYCNLKNFRMCIIVIESLTPLDRTSRIKLYKDNARFRLFLRIAKRLNFLKKLKACKLIFFIPALNKVVSFFCRWRKIKVLHGSERRRIEIQE